MFATATMITLGGRSVSDTMIDSNRKVTKVLTPPKMLQSRAYAIRLRAGDGTGLGEECVVFFVRPPVATGCIALLF